jgi:hypothetical protein
MKARLKALIDNLTADLGGETTEAEREFIKIAAANLLRAGDLTDAMARGETVSDEALVRMSNTSQRIMRELREERARREENAGKGKPGAALRQYLADAAARKAAQADDEGAGDEIDCALATFPLPDIEPESVQTPAEPAPLAIEIATEPKPTAKAAVEHDGILHRIIRPYRHIVSTISVRMDSRPGVEPGRQLTEIVRALRSKAPNATVRLTTPSIDTDATVADLAIEVGLAPGVRPFHLAGVNQTAARHSWFVQGISL